MIKTGDIINKHIGIIGIRKLLSTVSSPLDSIIMYNLIPLFLEGL